MRPEKFATPMSPSTLACAAGPGAARPDAAAVAGAARSPGRPSRFTFTLSTHLPLPYSLLLLFCTGRISEFW